MRLTSLLLIVAGGVLPLAGVAWAYVRGRSRLGVLDQAEQIRDDLQARERAGDETFDFNAELRAAGIPATTNGDITIILALMERSIVRESTRSLVGPAVLGLLGIAAGTVGGALALYLPA